MTVWRSFAAFPAFRGVLHCYSGSAEAMTYARMGWYLSFTGVVT